ncbi:hypothetical protein [uncultured Alsobacter sp.]|uniref:hypothetical protein n=1 Tax=uncultured Alsobacter sp. TaxID=1748258 RepID=UPI0025F7A72D|nr:hypothetical protein [uncultured Alsobacter sp.]
MVTKLMALLAVLALAPAAFAGEPRVFSPDSFWYRKLPANTPLHPESAEFVKEFQRQKAMYYGTVGINTVDYASPVYVVKGNEKTTKVQVWDCFSRGTVDAGLARQWEDVPIPPGAQQAGGTDAEMTIYQPSTDTIWEFWQARQTEGRWEACWGGRMANASRNPGIWPRPYGTTATGLPFLGGQLSVAELKSGRIEHAIGIALVETAASSVVSWPANRSDGENPDNAPNRIPQGLRFRLDPAVDVNALDMHPIGKMIARAAQTYGFVVWDKAGAIMLRAENPKSFTVRGEPNPYDALFAGTPQYAILEGFPWHRLQFLPHDFGKP